MFCNDLVGMCIDRGWFPEQSADALGRKGPHVQLKVLSMMRVLGRAVCLDECKTGTGIKEEILRVFFHAFCEKFAIEVFPMVCKPPTGIEVIAVVSCSTDLCCARRRLRRYWQCTSGLGCQAGFVAWMLCTYLGYAVQPP